MSQSTAIAPARLVSGLLRKVSFVARILALVASTGLLIPPGAWGQQCGPVTGDFSENADILVMKADKSCTVEDGGYIRTSTSYKLHVTATVTGWCQTYGTSGCVPIGYYIRTASSTTPKINGSAAGVIFASNGVQSYATCGNDDCTAVNCSGPKGWSPFTQMGTYIYTADNKTGGGPLACGMVGFTYPANQSVTMHALSCKPEWFVGGTPTVNFHGPASGNIKIVIPSAAFEDARTPAEAAAADWAQALGRTISVEPGYGSCTPSDPLCIELKNDHGTQPGDPPGCASFGTASYNPATGEWTASTSVRFQPNWTGGHPDNLRWTVAPELGHYFGAENRLHTSCSQANTVMGSGNWL